MMIFHHTHKVNLVRVRFVIMHEFVISTDMVGMVGRLCENRFMLMLHNTQQFQLPHTPKTTTK